MLLCDLSVDVLAQILNISSLVDILPLCMTGNRRLQSKLSHGGVRKLIFAADERSNVDLRQLWAKCLEGFALHQVSYSYDHSVYYNRYPLPEVVEGRNWLKMLQNCLKVLELEFASSPMVIFPSASPRVAKEEVDEDKEETDDDDEPSPYVTLDAEEGETVAKMASRLGMDIAKGNAFYRLSKVRYHPICEL